MAKKKNDEKAAVTIDELLQTGDECYNDFARRVATKCVSGQIFPDVERAVQLFGECRNIISGADKPFEAVRAAMYLLYQMQTPELTERQIYFILTNVADYISPLKTEYENWELQTETFDILKSHIKKMDIEQDKIGVKTADIRETLKSLMQKEIEALPERLKGLDDEKRLAVVCKLIPYVVPKIETVEPSRGENRQWYDN